MGCSQVVLSALWLPRESTPNATQLPSLKLLCSNAADPESPSQVLSPETNSPEVSSIFASGSVKQSVNVVSLGMHVSATFSLMRRVPAVIPIVSVGEVMPYPMAVTTGSYCELVIGGVMTGSTYCGRSMLSARIMSAMSLPHTNV